MLSMDMNCDMGESFGSYTLGYDSEAMPHVTLAERCLWISRIRSRRHGENRFYGKKNGCSRRGASRLILTWLGFGRRNMALSLEETKACRNVSESARLMDSAGLPA